MVMPVRCEVRPRTAASRTTPLGCQSHPLVVSELDFMTNIPTRRDMTLSNYLSIVVIDLAPFYLH